VGVAPAPHPLFECRREGLAEPAVQIADRRDGVGLCRVESDIVKALPALAIAKRIHAVEGNPP